MAGNGRRNADETLALGLAAGQTLTDAAGKAGVSERTARRRQDDPAFRARVVELRRTMLQQSLGRMADGMTEAADVLRGLLKASSESVRLGACRAMLELGVKLRDTIDHEERLESLEMRLNRGDGDERARKTKPA
jgi:hypothetical protein